MAVREIVQIDEEKCNGCGECIPNCHEGALRIIDGKARLIRDTYCDGLGACLGTCPQDAITIVEREAEDFDLQAVSVHQSRGGQHSAGAAGCPGAAMMDTVSDADANVPATGAGHGSALAQWPIQLHLVPPDAPFFDGADLLLAADCTPFALADFHERLLRGRRLLIGCPKLDDSAYYAEKLGAILNRNDIRSLTVVHMEVPCCFGLIELAKRALAASGKHVPVKEVIVSLRGQAEEGHGLTGTKESAAVGKRD